MIHNVNLMTEKFSPESVLSLFYITKKSTLGLLSKGFSSFFYQKSYFTIFLNIST